MTQVSSIGAVAPQAVEAPLAAVADKHFAYVLQGLIGAQLARSAAPSPAADAPVTIPSGEVAVGPGGPTTITAFRFWHRVLPVGGDS